MQYSEDNKKNIKVSIAMTSYNGEKYILEQLISFTKQSVLPDELVICDDNSQDNTVQILKEFAKTAPFETKIIVNNPGLGFAQNFSKALANTTGDLVFLCDQDDVWFEKRIETYLKYYKNQPNAQLFKSNASCTDSKLNETNITLFDVAGKNGHNRFNAIEGCLLAIKRNLLDIILPIPNGLPHDYWINHICRNLNLTCPIDEVLMFYRRHENAFSFNYIGQKKNWLAKIKKIFVDKIKNFIDKHSIKAFYIEKNKYSRLKNLMDILCSNPSKYYWFKPKDNINYINEINNKKLGFDSRLKVIEASTYKRPTLIMKALKKGSYKPFHGFRTAFDDFFKF